MWVAVPTFGELVAPRFGFCDEITVANVIDGSIVEREVLRPGPFGCHHRLSRLADMEVEALLSGGFNRKFLPLAHALGMSVRCGCSGKVEEILAAFAKGEEIGFEPGELDGCGLPKRGMGRRRRQGRLRLGKRGPSS